jgi:AbrB family looped-hinge helix DNA binding protein
MKRNIDNLGRIVIPSEMRNELGIKPNQELDIEKVGNKIIITNPEGILSRDEIETMYRDICKTDNGEYNNGFRDALKMILKK